MLLFKSPSGNQLKISSTALQQLRAYCQLSITDKEAGGVLLGRILLDSADVVVDEVSEPMAGDKRSRFAFYRHKRGHQIIINRRWKESEGTCNYLGEWHTHPEPIPTPSMIDWTDWKRKLKSDQFGDSIYLLILGTIEARMWVGKKQSGLILPMENLYTALNQ